MFFNKIFVLTKIITNENVRKLFNLFDFNILHIWGF
jgi:hypothetical protein